jgi:hypothetical protein
MIDESLDIITATGKKSRGGINSYEDIRKNSVQRVRGEFLAATFRPKITFAIDSVTFNTSCVNLFPNNQHIVINIDEKDQRVIVEPCKAYDRDSLKFATLKGEKNNPRKCLTRLFCAMLYDFMGWNQAAKYRIMAIFQEFDGKQIIVFNLDESLQVFSELIELDDGTKKRNAIIKMPEDWKGRFGHTLDELEKKNKIDAASTLITIDNKTGERRSNIITAKLPTSQELIHQPYGGMRPRQREDGSEGI